MEIKNRLVKYILASIVFPLSTWVIMESFIENIMSKSFLSFEVIISLILSLTFLYASFISIFGLILEIKKIKEK